MAYTLLFVTFSITLRPIYFVLFIFKHLPPPQKKSSESEKTQPLHFSFLSLVYNSLQVD